MLEWAGTKNAGPAPGLAREAAGVTIAGLIVVFLEGMIRAMWTGLHGIRETKHAYDARYTATERQDLEVKIREAVDQAPGSASTNS